MVQSIKKDSEVTVGYMHWMVTREDLLAEGRAEGWGEALTATVSMLKNNGFSKDKIKNILVKDYNVSCEELEKYIV